MSARISRRTGKNLTVAAVLALATGLLASQGVLADVLKVAPKDSLAVIKIKNLEGTSKKVADLSAKLGIAAMNPDMADPLGSMLAKGKIKDGLKKDGEMGIIFLPAAMWPAGAMDGPDKEPAAVLLLPITDYKTFLGNFEGAKTDAGISEVQWDGKPGFVADWGEYAAISSKKENVATKGDGLTVNPAAAREFGSKDLVLWANIPALKTIYNTKTAADKDKWLAKIDEEMQKNPDGAKYAPVAKAAVSQFIAAADSFFATAQGATISINLTDAGVNTSVAAEFAPDSYIGKFVSSLKGETGSVTRGLPGGPYLFFGGFSMNGDAMITLVKDITDPIMKELVTVDPANGAEGQKIMDAFVKMSKAAKFSSAGMLAPRGALGAESIVQMAAVIKGDSKLYAQGFKEYSESYVRLLPAISGGKMPVTMEFKPAAKTVDGVVFDVLAVNPNPNPKTPEEAQIAQMMGMMYGPNGLSSDIGVVDDKSAIVATGLSDATISKLIAAAKGETDELSKMPNIAATTKELPAKPVGAFYIAVDEMVKTGVGYARQFGAPVNVALPDNLPPVGVAVDTDGSTLKLDTHIPSELVQSLVAAWMQMQGGGGGGGGL